MLLERFDEPGLSQYSYAVGCEATRQIAIVDPRRDVDVYLDFAARRRLTIACVLETHIHADFASGARELAERSGAPLRLSGHDTGERYEVAFPHEELRDGDAVVLGKVRIAALHTPGHTPEHLSFLVFDGARSESVPIAMLSGDFLFVGSLGRPDLLGEDAKRALAQTLFRSVRDKLGGLPDGLEIHPGHGAGSLCGAGMSARPFSTLGYERIANPYLDPRLDEEAFVARILASSPPFPPYYRRMKELNARGPRPLGDSLTAVPALTADRFRALAGDGRHVVVDLRDQLSFGAGHVPGAFGIDVREQISTWAAWVVPYERPLLLVAAEPADLERGARALARVGLDEIVGHLDGSMAAWSAAGYPVEELPQLSAAELDRRRAAGTAPPVLDVRSVAEWRSGHLAGAVHIPGGEVADRLAELPDGPLAVVCGGGFRSTVAASVLQRAGREVFNVTGGMGAWKRAGLPTETG